MVTAVGDDDSRQQILQAGADEFLIKPYQSEDVVRALSDGFARFTQPEPEVSVIKPVRVNGLPPFVGVVITAGRGSPLNISKLFDFISKDCPASYFVVQHGPEWMTELLAHQIRLETARIVNEQLLPNERALWKWLQQEYIFEIRLGHTISVENYSGF